MNPNTIATKITTQTIPFANGGKNKSTDAPKHIAANINEMR